jgi:hypothetical protein
MSPLRLFPFLLSLQLTVQVIYNKFHIPSCIVFKYTALLRLSPILSPHKALTCIFKYKCFIIIIRILT